jgi:hypothetical protein
MYTVSPATRVLAAFWIVRQGWASLPGFESLPVVAT